MKTPELYFIGGAPLCGKSEVATYALKAIIPHAEKAPQYIGTDGLRRVLWKNIDPTKHPDFFQMHNDRAKETEGQWLETARNNPDRWPLRQHKESAFVWEQGIRHLLDCNVDRGLPTIVEGVAALPHLTAQYPHPHRAVFIGHTGPASPEHRQNINTAIESVPDHWMREWSTEKREAYLNYIFPKYSEYLEDMVNQQQTEHPEFGYRYFDLANGNYEEIHQEAAAYLIKQTD